MCGISGIVARRRVNLTAVEAMNALIRHRGPDGEGVWQSADRQVVLGHRRLAVIDPTPAGAQPMVSPRGDLVLTFNGEIYNYLELGDDLKADGSIFNSKSDSEVLLQGYARYGEDVLRHLNGMFAFAIYDSVHRRLFCARDRFGEKPLLYVHGPGFFAFASEYKALLSLAEVSHNVDTDRLLNFLNQPRIGLDSERDTVFREIKQLLPGEYLFVDLESMDVSVMRYWHPQTDPALSRLDDREAVERFRSLLIDSVKIRMRSDVPVGSCLSGGLDSGSIVCLNRQILGGTAPYHVFTGRFPGTGADEWPYAQEIVNAANVTSHLVEPLPGTFLDDLPDFMWHNELPVGSSSQFAQWCVFRLAKESGVTVLLDGQGADELLAGYEQYFREYLTALRASGDYDREEELAIRSRYPTALLGPKQSLAAQLPQPLRYGMAQLLKKGSDFRFGLSRSATNQVRAVNGDVVAGVSALTDKLLEDSFVAHLPTLLRYGDRNSMAHSREVRLPFCDHRIAELTLSLAPRTLIGEAQTKRLLREAMKGILPERVRTRWNKQGFLPPQESWMEGKLLGWIEETIASPAFAARGFWNVPWWKSALKRLQSGEHHMAWELWRPVICEAWYQYVITRAAGMPRHSVFAATRGDV
ncbi:MAG: asparagine synthase (glutamine-hydrolyzing) [Magnetovibrio sp.]|nr:asparagine synthase (glutamine-hydrolyzing) [Magnetovibrio sp.]